MIVFAIRMSKVKLMTMANQKNKSKSKYPQDG